MINCSRLLRVTETREEVEKHLGKEAWEVPKHLIRYSRSRAPMVIWNITRKCNLRCPICHLGSAPNAGDRELSTREAKDLIDQMASMGVPLVSVYGGEPLTRPDFLELARYASQKGLRMIFSTNATLLTRGKAREIRRSGITYVGIDLDGLAQEGGGMDVMRGLRKSMPAVRSLQEANLRCGVRITLGGNLEELPAVLRAVEEMGIRRFAVCQLLEARSWKEIKEERRRLMDFLIGYARDNPHMEVVTEHFYADGAYIYEKLRQSSRDAAEALRKLLLLQGGCPAGRKLVNIDEAGNLHPCLYWKDYTLGNIREEGLRKLWSGENEVLRKLRKREEYLRGRCGKCAYAAMCGGCRARAAGAYGDYLSSDPACYLSTLGRVT